MPVQENEDKRTPEQILSVAVEEIRRKQAHQQEENSVQKSGKLLPFMNAKAEIHQNRIDNLNEKIANQKDKLARQEAKIDRMTNKAERLEDINIMLKSTLGNLSAVRKLIESNEEKSQKSVTRKSLPA